MTITFSCQCGKQIKVADKFAGRTGKCPACGELVTIPQPELDLLDNDPDLIYEALSPKTQPDPVQQPDDNDKCNACGKPMPTKAVFCTQCGFHRISHTYIKNVQVLQPEDKESKAALFNFAGFALRWWKLAIVLLPLLAVTYWYLTGPARDVLVLTSQTVNIIQTIKHGATREPFSIYTQQGDKSLGIKGPKSKSNPNPLIGAGEVFSLGGRDRMIVIKPDDKGTHISLQVALAQGTIRDNNRTSRYDSIIEAQDFKLVPNDGSKPIDARLLYKNFENTAEIDLSGANTSSYQALFPSEPNSLDKQQQFGSITGDAAWNSPSARGKINFSSSYATGDFPAAKGLRATGKIKVFNDAGDSAYMQYDGSTLNIKWDTDSQGWWEKDRYTHQSQPSPWYRYNFALIFDRPQVGGDFDLTYCDKIVATVSIDPLPQPKAPPLSPIKRANANTPPPPPSNNPLTYFKVLSDARNQARGIVSASNLRQLGIAMQLYIQQNNAWPDRIDQLQSVMPGYEKIMQNPRTKEKIGFVYTKPQPGSPPATTPIIHEAWQEKPDPNGAVLYADGHIE
jgi:hypothetical protein